MAKERVLIIDDDPDVRMALTCMLEPAGYEVICCATGEEGLAAAGRVHPDVILLDVMLASPSEGFHLAYQLKEDETSQAIPIIMISAIGARMGLDYAKELGSDYLPVEKFLDKPLDSKTILGVIREVLAGRSRPVT
jgi:DNA-binding response OmpR family regulator